MAAGSRRCRDTGIARVIEEAGMGGLSRKKQEMIEWQLEARGIRDAHVLAAMREVPREAFVRQDLVEFAYEDNPLPIEEQQTISQPYIVALMAELLQIKPGDRVLDIGTGSGYAAAVMSRIAAKVCTVERHKLLADAARERLDSLGLGNIEVLHGDGTQGWPEFAPFDAINIAAAGAEVPEPLKEQLAEGGRLVMPVSCGLMGQRLVRLTRRGGEFESEHHGYVRFVPLIREPDNPGVQRAPGAVAQAPGLPARPAQDQPRIPAWLRWVYLAFVLVLVPVYAMEYGPRNFLWFSNVALLLGLVGVWAGNRMIVSTQAVSILLLELGWLVGFLGGLLRGGDSPFGLTAYMFDPGLPLFVRGLSLYHLVLPWLLLWLVWRLGYDRRAWRVWTPAGWGILLLIFAMPGEDNVNWVHEFPAAADTPLPPLAWLAVVMLACAVVWFLTHRLIGGVMRWFGRPVHPLDAGAGQGS
jgi:protein-L-isoaspartate(D-aspartate) O-methyltransferase